MVALGSSPIDDLLLSAKLKLSFCHGMVMGYNRLETVSQPWFPIIVINTSQRFQMGEPFTLCKTFVIGKYGGMCERVRVNVRVCACVWMCVYVRAWWNARLVKLQFSILKSEIFFIAASVLCIEDRKSIFLKQSLEIFTFLQMTEIFVFSSAPIFDVSSFSFRRHFIKTWFLSISVFYEWRHPTKLCWSLSGHSFKEKILNDRACIRLTSPHQRLCYTVALHLSKP